MEHNIKTCSIATNLHTGSRRHGHAWNDWGSRTPLPRTRAGDRGSSPPLSSRPPRKTGTTFLRFFRRLARTLTATVMNNQEPADQGCKRTDEKADSRPRVRAIGYVRVSTDEQVQGNGLEVQTQAIRRYCEDNDLRLVETASDEGIS